MSIASAEERAALAQVITNQPDGPGKRIGKRGELILIAPIIPGTATLFRTRLAQFQKEAAYWEGRVGTVQDLRLLLIDNDTRLLFALTYDGDFKPYLIDISTQARPWLDGLFVGVVDGYKGLEDPGAGAFIAGHVVPSEFFYVANPELSVHDVQKTQRVTKAVQELLDAAS
jgi:hypothetical protein